MDGRQNESARENCLDVMVKNTIIVTAMSSNHFAEGQNLIGSIQQKMPGTKIIVYNIGMTTSQLDQLRHICDLELRNFDFDRYPSHVSRLLTYAWKPLIINEVSHEYEIIVWSDSSIRLKSSLKEHAFPHLLTTNWTFLGSMHQSHTNIVQLTHDSTLKYFNLTRENLTNLPQLQAGFGVYWMTDNVQMIVNDWVDCAMHMDCIAPKGSMVGDLSRCTKIFGGPQQTRYSGCHRFDQSALDLIIFKRYGRGMAEMNNPIAQKTFTVARGYERKSYNIRRC